MLTNCIMLSGASFILVDLFAIELCVEQCFSFRFEANLYSSLQEIHAFGCPKTSLCRNLRLKLNWAEIGQIECKDSTTWPQLLYWAHMSISAMIKYWVSVTWRCSCTTLANPRNVLVMLWWLRRMRCMWYTCMVNRYWADAHQLDGWAIPAPEAKEKWQGILNDQHTR